MKKLLALALALVLCLGLTAPAFAVDYFGNHLYPPGNWGDGPSLTLKGVTAGREVDLELPMCYDVAVGGSMVLKLDFPAGHNRTYGFRIAGVYVSPNWDDCLIDESGMSLARWDIPEEKMAYDIGENDGKTEYVYEFTESDMGQLKGYSKAIYMDVYWMDDIDGDGQSDGDGSAYFYIHVVPAEPEIPRVQLSHQGVTLDGEAVDIQAYNIGGANFFKLRDVAMLLNGTDAQFSVDYDADAGAVIARSGEPYTPIGGELTAGEDMSAKCVVSRQSIAVDGTKLDADVYNIGGSNYFKLRDLGAALGFGVDYDAATGTVLVTTK